MMNYGNEFKKFATKHLGMNTQLVEASMTPMILEERELRVTQMSVFDRMMMDRILWLYGGVDDRMASIVQAQLLFLDSVETKDITLQISSPGGSVPAGLAIVDVMNYISSDVSTINLGMCASMGSVLLASGKKGKRNALINSKTMIHHISSGTEGVIDDQRISIMEAEKYNYILFKMMAKSCGKTFEQIHEDSKRDRWFNSDQSLEYGFVDNIIGLDKNDSISTLMEGFDDYFKKVYNRG